MLSEAVVGSLNFYRKQKPIPTFGCIIDGRSCSQRFEDTFKSAIESGVPAMCAFIQAVKYAKQVCVQINQIPDLSAYARLFFATPAYIIFSPLSSTSDQGNCCFKENPSLTGSDENEYEKRARMSEPGAAFRAGLLQIQKTNPEKTLREVYEKARRDLLETGSDEHMANLDKAYRDLSRKGCFG